MSTPEGNISKSVLSSVNDLDLRLLRIFITVTECQGFSAASAELGLGRSAISRYMNKLEQRLGGQLCHRGRSGFQLTQQGRVVLQEARKLFQSIEDFKDGINSIGQDISGTLRIGMLDFLVTSDKLQLIKVLGRILKTHSRTKVNIETRSPSEVETGVLAGNFHVGITSISKNRDSKHYIQSLEYVPLMIEEMGAYCSKDHPLFSANLSEMTIEDILQEDFVVPTYDNNLITMESEKALNLNCRYTADTTEAIATLILTGQAIGRVPVHGMRALEAAGEVRRLAILDEIVSSTLYLVYSKSTVSGGLTSLFIDEMRDSHPMTSQITDIS